ncbi:hypothetical protein RclHR1_09650013 [Rhizophagus clarus]|uniref:Uncharacterized protein n=1 Tax=Rhizophagus clarus TaxID=94130 RepID=A0A2Z6S760_9GLOM|nr:hypothetical protein RclHR1_09650013 [Rhizophagus clarus]GES84613.1 hypothetical protein GLOIN_2v1478598 [Rhizophagus clarus]
MGHTATEFFSAYPESRIISGSGIYKRECKPDQSNQSGAVIATRKVLYILLQVCMMDEFLTYIVPFALGSEAIIKKKVRMAIPEKKCSDEALRKKTERSEKVYKLFNTIGKEKIARIRSISSS